MSSGSTGARMALQSTPSVLLAFADAPMTTGFLTQAARAPARATRRTRVRRMLLTAGGWNDAGELRGPLLVGSGRRVDTVGDPHVVVRVLLEHRTKIDELGAGCLRLGDQRLVELHALVAAVRRIGLAERRAEPFVLRHHDDACAARLRVAEDLLHRGTVRLQRDAVRDVVRTDLERDERRLERFDVGQLVRDDLLCGVARDGRVVQLDLASTRAPFCGEERRIRTGRFVRRADTLGERVAEREEADLTGLRIRSAIDLRDGRWIAGGAARRTRRRSRRA